MVSMLRAAADKTERARYGEQASIPALGRLAEGSWVSGVGMGAPCVKVLASTNDLSSVPGSHLEEGEN